MKEIGELLKNKRLELGLTIEQIADMTKMPIIRIKAIEEGDIRVFKDDFTYLQFFVQSYCNAVGVNYREIKKELMDSLNEYTTSFESEQVKKQLETEKSIREQSVAMAREYRVKNPQKRQRKIDFSVIFFATVVALILICVIVVGGYYLTHNNNQPEADPLPPVVENNQDKPQNVEPEEPEVLDVTVEKKDATHYEVKNVTEKIVVRIEFESNSWFLASMDDVVMTNPESKVYSASEKIEVEMLPTDQQLSLKFGYFPGIKIFVNDQALEIDETIQAVNVQEIYIMIGGENSEPTE